MRQLVAGAQPLVVKYLVEIKTCVCIKFDKTESLVLWWHCPLEVQVFRGILWTH